MTKSEFLDQYIVTFLATLTANRYDKYIDVGEDGFQSLQRHDGVNDALKLAECAWKRFEKIRKGELS